MSGQLGAIYSWSHQKIVWLFTLFIIFQSVGMLLGGMLRDKVGPRWNTATAVTGRPATSLAQGGR